jgi:hypothetical protein
MNILNRFNIDWFNPNDIILGFNYVNGETDDGNDIEIYSLGFLFFNINYTIYYENIDE